MSVSPITSQPQPSDGPVKPEFSDRNRMERWIETAGNDVIKRMSGTDAFIVNRNDDLCQVLTSAPSRKGFTVRTPGSEFLYKVTEESCVCCCEQPDRSFIIHIFDKDETEIMRAVRKKKLCTCFPFLCYACADEIVLQNRDGNVIGYVTQLCQGAYRVMDNERNLLLRINYTCWQCCVDCCTCKCKDCCTGCKCTGCKCTCCTLTCCATKVEIPIFDVNNVLIGWYLNRWAMKDHAQYGDGIKYQAHYPGGLTDLEKALLMAGGFLMNVIAFEPAERCCYF